MIGLWKRRKEAKEEKERDEIRTGMQGYLPRITVSQHLAAVELNKREEEWQERFRKAQEEAAKDGKICIPGLHYGLSYHDVRALHGYSVVISVDKEPLTDRFGWKPGHPDSPARLYDKA